MTSNSKLVRTALIVTGIVLTSAGAANAQLADVVKFTTTFPFVVGGKTLPAGAYTATPIPADPMVLQISNGHTAALMLTENDLPKVHPRHDEVTFVKRGDAYVLSEIWDAATSMGVEPVDAHIRHAVRGAKNK